MIPLAIIWAGYTLAFYGYATLKQTAQNGVGLTDLVIPSRICKVVAAMNGWSGFSSNSSSNSSGSNGGGNSSGGVPIIGPHTTPQIGPKIPIVGPHTIPPA